MHRDPATPRAHIGHPPILLSPGSSVHPRRNSIFSRGFSFSWQVARQLQPSVVWIGDTEKTFYKRVPNAERMVSAPPALLSLGSAFPRGGPFPGSLSSSRRSCFFKGGRRRGEEVQPSLPGP